MSKLDEKSINSEKSKQLKWLVNFIIALIPALIVYILIIKEPFFGIDAMLCDLVYSQMNGTGDEIKLICVDEETLDAYGTFSEWSRDKSAQLLNWLYEDEDTQPAVVAIDIMFVGETDASTDERLADAAKGKNVVTTTNLVFRGKTQYNTDGTPYYSARNIEMEEYPYDALLENIETGYANTDISKDGFVRTSRLITNVDGIDRYSFATQVYLSYMKTQGQYEEALAKIQENPQVQFFYSGKPEEFSHYSLKDVLDGKIPKEAFKGCVVMVGAYAPGMQDSYHSAAKRSKEMYGVEINANITRALMTDKTATRLPVKYVAMVAAVLLFIFTFFSREMNMYPALLAGSWIILIDIIAGRIFATHGKVMSLIYVLIITIFVMVCIVVEKYVWETIKKKRVLNSFKKYMAPQVIENMSKDDKFHIELGGEKRNVAVLFVDIRGFTSLSEKLNPEQIVQILNRYLTLTSECIFDHNGMLDKFIGDATMAIFNAPNDQEDYVYQAVLAGLDMQKKGSELGKELQKEYGRTVNFGVGIHVGEAVVGNIGSSKRMDYTAIGDTVNTASRIEGKSASGELLISEEVYKILEGRIKAEFKEEMSLKGKEKPVPVYSVTGIVEMNEKAE